MTAAERIWVYAVYFSPSLTRSEIAHELGEIGNTIKQERRNFMIGGDFNMNWDLLERMWGDLHPELKDVIRKSTGTTRKSMAQMDTS